MLITANDADGRAFVEIFLDCANAYEANQAKWRDELRGIGVVATHPDDGWVDRVNNSIWFCYPYILGDVKAGCVIALGDHENYRLVRLTRFVPSFLKKEGEGRWFFEEIP